VPVPVHLKSPHVKSLDVSVSVILTLPVMDVSIELISIFSSPGSVIIVIFLLELELFAITKELF
jgi:hypothetical protein